METLHGRFSPSVPKTRDRYSSHPEAYDHFMSGLRESYSKEPAALWKALAHLAEAIELDPEFALAHAILSHVSMILHFEFEPQEEPVTLTGRGDEPPHDLATIGNPAGLRPKPRVDGSENVKCAERAVFVSHKAVGCSSSAELPDDVPFGADCEGQGIRGIWNIE
jgi:hypothetical protein